MKRSSKKRYSVEEALEILQTINEEDSDGGELSDLDWSEEEDESSDSESELSTSRPRSNPRKRLSNLGMNGYWFYF